MELLDTIAAEATAISVLCVAWYHSRHRRREPLVVCLGSAGARLQDNGSLRRVDVGADAPNEAVGFDLLRGAGLASQDAVPIALLQNRATELVGKDTIRGEARQVESSVDGHAVG